MLSGCGTLRRHSLPTHAMLQRIMITMNGTCKAVSRSYVRLVAPICSLHVSNLRYASRMCVYVCVHVCASKHTAFGSFRFKTHWVISKHFSPTFVPAWTKCTHYFGSFSNQNAMVICEFNHFLAHLSYTEYCTKLFQYTHTYKRWRRQRLRLKKVAASGITYVWGNSKIRGWTSMLLFLVWPAVQEDWK